MGRQGLGAGPLWLAGQGEPAQWGLEMLQLRGCEEGWRDAPHLAEARQLGWRRVLQWLSVCLPRPTFSPGR